MGKGVLYQYREFLPISKDTPILSMGEGDTPLVQSRRLGDDIGVGSLHFKLEGCNPTGSFKDRGMVVAIAKTLETNRQKILCASTGNTSASAAAYGAAAGIHTVVLVPDGQIAEGKLSQATAYGARIIQIEGNFDAALNIARQLAERYDISLVNSVNPYRIEGQKTAAFEIIDTLGNVPDMLFIPVGNAGNITAYWRGFKQYFDAGLAKTLPRLMGVQAEGASPIVQGKPISDPQTIASAIRIGNPASWISAVQARDESGGDIFAVSDDDILDAYKLLARQEGIFCEPASAASLAGLIKQCRSGEIDMRNQTIVCVITGNGLKDPSTAMQVAGRPMEKARPTFEDVATILGI